MRAQSTRRTKPAPDAETGPRNKRVLYELIGLACITLGVILLLCPHWEGQFSRYLLEAMQWLFGVYGAWGVGLAVITLGIFLMVNLARVTLSMTVLGMTIEFLIVISALQLYYYITHPDMHYLNVHTFATTPGGCLGSLVALALYKVFGQLAWVVLAAFGLAGLSVMTDTPLWVLITLPFRLVGRGLARLFAGDPAMTQARRDSKARQVAALQADEMRRRNLPEPDDDATVVLDKTMILRPPPPPEPIEDDEEEAPPPARVRGVPSRKQPEQMQFDDTIVLSNNKPYVLPPLDLLTSTPKSAKPAKDDTAEKIATLEQTLSSFGIDAKVVGVERGPRVTRFEMVPPPGIRINRITNLADNIALSLAALDVRVEAPVPGKGVVGIEVPNKESVIVDLREIMESEAIAKGKTPLNFALGKDITGVPRCADLTRMPHLLIAGQTNSGKSVCINSLICSILMRATPQQVKFLMVDPKRVELSLYQSIPHLIAPVAYDAKHAAGLLRWAIREMEQRYEMFAEKGVRNIVGFNEQSRLDGLEELPYIVIIIDELADLMMQAAAEFEASICRIAQLARATGMHLVVATQRPSVNVITGTIKANIPSRISFAVASQVDSRTILDMNGAERLVGSGDMLYLPVDASKPSRIQGAYVSEKDTNRIVEYVKSQGKPYFSDDIIAIEEEAMNSNGETSEYNNEPEDELFNRALEFVRTTRYASTSMLQRKFRIGYTRAARLMDLFEERGYVGPGQGSKPREVTFAPASAVTGQSPRPRELEDEEM